MPMAGEINRVQLLKTMRPTLNQGEYVFVSVMDSTGIDRSITICEFKEKEGITIVLEKSKAEELQLKYDYVASWITLTVHSALEAVGFTAAFSAELTKHHISCNVIAGYYHDHIFVDKKDAQKAMKTLTDLAESHQ